MIKFNKLILFFLIILFTGDVSFGQDTLKRQNKNFIIKFPPILILGDYITTSVGIPFGFEIKINKKLSFDQDFSYIMSSGNNGGLFIVDVDKIKGIRSDSEIKRYINKKNNLTGFYLATHLLYQYTDAVITYNNGLNVCRNLVAIHEKIGWQFISRNGFVFDVALGFGTRYVTSRSGEDNYYISSNEFMPLYWYHKSYESGSKWFFSGTGDFKIGWAF